MKLYNVARIILITLVSLSLFSCATYYHSMKEPSIVERSYLLQGKRYFMRGYYRDAKRILYPLACDGNPEAQYAVGYMYYYGMGVTQDLDVGYFWIERSARQNFPIAVKALHVIDTQNMQGDKIPPKNAI